ncbi:MAG TPA: primary-amine oxidase [Acidimicrobiales bacterium]|nr:primary-amine oxidase [Acidimicrobiales bacterium]
MDPTISNGSTHPHPLDPLSADELRRAVAIVRADPRVAETVRFADVFHEEPTKSELATGDAGATAIDRRVRFRLVAGPGLSCTEVLVSLTGEAVLALTEVPGVCPTMLVEESWLTAEAVRADPRWQEAMRRRGIDDFAKVEVEPWPAGRFGLPEENGRRLGRAISYLREEPEDNQYARPIEGVVALVDLGRHEVIDVVDHGGAAVPAGRGRYHEADTRPWRDDLKPIEISQPDGPSFTLEGNLLSWQRWSMRVSLEPHEGIVLHTVGYEDGGRIRPILHRASITEMIVPYGHPGPMHGWKNAFDASEWGLGKMANSLARDCDCLGEIRYLDAAMVGERGNVYMIKNAVCIHEEDIGIGWKHVDLALGLSEVRRARRLVVSSIATAGNYDYGFFWYFHLDGSIEMEVKLTGIVTTIALEPGEVPGHASRITPELAAPHHQHLFCARLDFDIDGTANSIYEIDVEAEPAGPENPWGNAFAARATALEHELAAQRVVDPARSRVWKIVNPSVSNAAGDPVAYTLVPGATPTLLADARSSIGRRAGFATRNLWVTPYDPGERWAAGDYPNQNPGGDGLPRWTAADRSLVDTDLVLWHTFGVTHVVRPEQWPVMPVERTGFSLVPAGFFDSNPALDIPPGPLTGKR